MALQLQDSCSYYGHLGMHWDLIYIIIDYGTLSPSLSRDVGVGETQVRRPQQEAPCVQITPALVHILARDLWLIVTDLQMR